MFTGIVESVGTIARVTAAGAARLFRVEAPEIAASLSPGDSVSVNGVCLTVERRDATGFDATAVAATLERTTMGELAAGERVNLERAVSAARLFGGHLVQGHVDGVARVDSFRREAGALVLELPESVWTLCVDQGSLAVDGVSLTVGERRAERRVAIAVVPHTLARTTLAEYGPGRRVNVEADVIAKYVLAFVRRRESANFA
jgi:riboflavin synthase